MSKQLQIFFKSPAKIVAQAGRSIGTKNVPALPTNRSQNIHVDAVKRYPQVAPLPLPANIDPNETSRLLPQRARDISSKAIQSHQLAHNTWPTAGRIDITVDNSTQSNDPHVASYDCSTTVSLNSAMQSQVPTPFGGMHGFSHLNMPYGQWSQEGKFIAQDLQASHYTNLRQQVRDGWSKYTDGDKTIKFNSKGSLGEMCLFGVSIINPKSYWHGMLTNTKRYISTSSQPCLSLNKETRTQNETAESSTGILSRKDKLKKAVKEYGSTVIVFHITISLASLGAFYLLVSSGLDVVAILEYFGLGGSTLSTKIATGASTFVVAYAVHKVFAPVRISITLLTTPFIVRYLRLKGVLKPPKPTV